MCMLRKERALIWNSGGDVERTSNRTSVGTTIYRIFRKQSRET